MGLASNTRIERKKRRMKKRIRVCEKVRQKTGQLGEQTKVFIPRWKLKRGGDRTNSGCMEKLQNIRGKRVAATAKKD